MIRHSLQHATCVDQYVTLIHKYIFGVVTSLDLHMPLLILIIPERANHLVFQADIFPKPVLVGNALKIFQDFRCARITENDEFNAQFFVLVMRVLNFKVALTRRSSQEREPTRTDS